MTLKNKKDNEDSLRSRHIDMLDFARRMVPILEKARFELLPKCGPKPSYSRLADWLNENKIPKRLDKKREGNAIKKWRPQCVSDLLSFKASSIRIIDAEFFSEKMKIGTWIWCNGKIIISFKGVECNVIDLENQRSDFILQMYELESQLSAISIAYSLTKLPPECFDPRVIKRTDPKNRDEDCKNCKECEEGEIIKNMKWDAVRAEYIKGEAIYKEPKKDFIFFK